MDRLKRKINQYLIKWKNSYNKLPLIIKGARQIGKTNAIRNFRENNYKTFIEINSAFQPKFKTITFYFDINQKLDSKVDTVLKCVRNDFSLNYCMFSAFML